MVSEQRNVVFHVVENDSACFDAVLAVNPARALQARSCRLREHSNGFLCGKKCLGGLLQRGS